MYFFHFHEPTPEEVEAQRVEQERLKLEGDEFKHSFQRLFEELDETQLSTLRTMFGVMMSQENRELIAAQWFGMAAQALKFRYNICVTCQKNHDLEMSPRDERRDYDIIPDMVEELTTNVPEETDDTLPLWKKFSDLDRAMMQTYHLDDVYDQDSGVFLHFVCTGIEGMSGPCGVTYPSIQDRMLKSPEDCSGCHVRMMHG